MPDGGAQHFFRCAIGIDVSGVEHGHPGIQADIHQPLGALGIGIAPGFEEIAFAAKSAGAEGENRNLEARAAEQAIIHGGAFQWTLKGLGLTATVSTAPAAGAFEFKPVDLPRAPALEFPGGERIGGLHQRGDGTLDAFQCT